MKTVKLCNVHGMLGVRKEKKCLEIAKMMNGLIAVKVSCTEKIFEGDFSPEWVFKKPKFQCIFDPFKMHKNLV